MYKRLTFLLTICCLMITALSAQERYIDEVFSGVTVQTDLEYSNNVDVLAISQGATGPVSQLFDLYTPDGDTNSLRPVVVLYHTGNFLPQYFNGGPYGARNDSCQVEIATRLAKRGFVSLNATYRQGWQPTATEDSIRTGSLLQAVYRASQDAHAMARFLRKSVAEEGNPYGIDTSRIAYFGIGSGGYVVNAHNYLDRVDEILLNPNFYTPSGIPLVNESINSNPQGTLPTMQNVPNHVGYNSSVAFTYNVGGALGDTLWMDGAGPEAPAAGLHSLTDPFAPFFAGTVIVPTMPPMPVVDVQGTNLVLDIANQKGNNDVLAPANALDLDARFGATARFLNQRNAAYKQLSLQSPISTATRDFFPLGRDNLLAVLRLPADPNNPDPNSPSVGDAGATSGLQNWFDEARLRGTIAAINMAIPTANLDADAIIDGDDQTNPNRNNPEAAKTFIDTIMAHFIPRAYFALDIEGLVSSTNEVVDNAAVGFQLFPNPASTGFTVNTEAGYPIRTIRIADINGRVVRTISNVNATTRFVERDNLPTGTYIVQLQLDEGLAVRKIMLN